MNTNVHFDHLSLIYFRMRNVSDKIVEKIKTHFMFSNIFSYENCAIHKIKWKNIVKPERPLMTVWHMCIAFWIPKATNTHSEYLIFIAFPCNNGCTNMPHYYIIHTLPVLLSFYSTHTISSQRRLPLCGCVWILFSLIDSGPLSNHD